MPPLVRNFSSWRGSRAEGADPSCPLAKGTLVRDPTPPPISGINVFTAMFATSFASTHLRRRKGCGERGDSRLTPPEDTCASRGYVRFFLPALSRAERAPGRDPSRACFDSFRPPPPLLFTSVSQPHAREGKGERCEVRGDLGEPVRPGSACIYRSIPAGLADAATVGTLPRGAQRN